MHVMGCLREPRYWTIEVLFFCLQLFCICHAEIDVFNDSQQQSKMECLAVISERIDEVKRPH